ncbi:MAG: MGMT family protein [Anaerolineae bacterium]|nr:MGMT family protein [Anaerolineae bacterium]
MTNDLFEKIYALARAIPSGKVTTYGQLGAMVGLSDMRAVGDAMNACPPDVPWQRVINARGTISIGGANGARQRILLEQEGVEFDENGRVDFGAVGWKPDADWLATNGYKQPPPLVKEKNKTKNQAGDAGGQMSLF